MTILNLKNELKSSSLAHKIMQSSPGKKIERSGSVKYTKETLEALKEA